MVNALLAAAQATFTWATANNSRKTLPSTPTTIQRARSKSERGAELQRGAFGALEKTALLHGYTNNEILDADIND